MKKFELIKVGDRAKIEHVIDKSDIARFVKITGDRNKLHLDEKFARKTTSKKPLVHGMLGASFISTVIGTKLPGHGALWYSQNLDFLLPIRLDDKIFVEATIIKKIIQTRCIEIAINIFNQKKQLVTRGKVGVKVLPNVKIISEKRKITEKKIITKRRKKLALVIGATGGIGYETCMELAKLGFDIAIHCNKNYIKAKKILKKIRKIGRKSIAVRFDSTSSKQVKKNIELINKKFKFIDLIVDCSTAELYNIKFERLDWSDIQKQIDVSIKGLFNILSLVLPTMKKNKHGNIICFSSQYVDSPKSELLHYTIAKSALSSFVKSIAIEYSPFGIRANIISPGMTETDLIMDVPEKTKLVTAAQTPLRRLANAKDMAGVVNFLATDKSGFLTGETIRVNGGQIML